MVTLPEDVFVINEPVFGSNVEDERMVEVEGKVEKADRTLLDCWSIPGYTDTIFGFDNRSCLHCGYDTENAQWSRL